jgi:VanZ family protein
VLQKLYILFFWFGYTAVLVASMLNLPGALDEVKLNILFELRLDHLLHFLAYFMISMYFMAGLWKGLLLFKNHQLWKFVVATVALGIFTEFIQLWVPSRAFNVFDIVSNVSGIGIGVIVIMVVMKNHEAV